MGLEEFLHMNEGDGELSYSQNSFLQKGVSLMCKPMLVSAIESLIKESSPCKGLNMADLGCGVGPVPAAVVSLVIENVERKCKELKWSDDQMPEIQIYLNDLPSNDFNLLFKTLFSSKLLRGKNGVPLCFLVASPGSYYARLFPRNSLHFVHANYTLHWLSQVPPELYSEKAIPVNKGSIYISDTSPKAVGKAYVAQFEQDFTQFLRCRSEEVVSQGRMLLSFRGRPSSSDVLTWQPWELRIFAQAINDLVFQGLIKEEKLDSFNFPYYGACKEEIQAIVKMEGSFAIEDMKTMAHPVADEINDNQERATTIGNFMRAFSEPLVSYHFGEINLDPLYARFTELMLAHLASGEAAEHYTVIVLLQRK